MILTGMAFFLQHEREKIKNIYIPYYEIRNCIGTWVRCCPEHVKGHFFVTYEYVAICRNNAAVSHEDVGAMKITTGKKIRKKNGDIDILRSEFVAYRLDRSTVLRPFIGGKDDLAFLEDLLVEPGADLNAREYVLEGSCYVAVQRGVIVGTVTYFPPERCGAYGWYEKQHVACFGLMAVHPDCRDQGVGSRMIVALEKMARKDGALELALDIPEDAQRLVDFFKGRGFRPVGEMESEMFGRKTVVLSKKFLDRPVIFGEYTEAISKVGQE